MTNSIVSIHASTTSITSDSVQDGLFSKMDLAVPSSTCMHPFQVPGSRPDRNVTARLLSRVQRGTAPGRRADGAAVWTRLSRALSHGVARKVGFPHASCLFVYDFCTVVTKCFREC